VQKTLPFSLSPSAHSSTHTRIPTQVQSSVAKQRSERKASIHSSCSLCARNSWSIFDTELETKRFVFCIAFDSRSFCAPMSHLPLHLSHIEFVAFLNERQDVALHLRFCLLHASALTLKNWINWKKHGIISKTTWRGQASNSQC